MHNNVLVIHLHSMNNVKQKYILTVIDERFRHETIYESIQYETKNIVCPIYPNIILSLSELIFFIGRLKIVKPIADKAIIVVNIKLVKSRKLSELNSILFNNTKQSKEISSNVDIFIKYFEKEIYLLIFVTTEVKYFSFIFFILCTS